MTTTKTKRSLSFLMALLMVFSIFSITTIDASAASFTMVRQDQAVYKNYKYNKGTLYDTGCGIFALVNGVGYLTGKTMSVTDTAKWANSIGAYNKNGAEGSYRDILYPNAVKKYGSTYGFTGSGGTYAGSSSSKLINHLKNGGVAIGHVYNHFIAIVGYSGQKFHVIDSAPTSARGTKPSGDCWKTASQLASGQLKLDWFYLLSAKGKSSASSSSQTFPKCSSSCTTITAGLNNIGVNSSYSYRAQIAAANSISNYTGTAAQNNKMLSLLKAGTLKKPGSSSSTSSVTYFKKCSSSCTTITAGLNNIGVDSSYSYRAKIAAANSISGYTGTAKQNTSMLNLLKSGKLIKP